MTASKGEGFPEATPRPWLREIHDARGDEARIVIVSRNPKFTSGYYVICADEMLMRRDQTIIDYGLICEAVNSYDALQEQNRKLREACESALKWIDWATDISNPEPDNSKVVITQLRAALREEK